MVTIRKLSVSQECLEILFLMPCGQVNKLSFSIKNNSIHLMKEVDAIGKNLNELLNCTKSLNDRMLQNVNLHRC